MSVTSPEQRVAKWGAIKQGVSAATSEPKDPIRDFGLGRYMPLTAAVGGERPIQPQSVAKAMFDMASNDLNVHDPRSLVRYWQAREDANNAMPDEQLTPEQLEQVKQWHQENPAPPPVELRSDGVPADGGAADAGIMHPGEENVQKWQAIGSGGADLVSKWKSLSKSAPKPAASPVAA